jgi:cytoskeletal protein RodZ
MTVRLLHSVDRNPEDLVSRQAKRRARAQQQQQSATTAEPLTGVAPVRNPESETQSAGGQAIPPVPDRCADDRPPPPEPAPPAPSRPTKVLHSAMGKAFVADVQVGPAAWLREAREEKGLTLDDLARTTKISLGTLAALEAGAIERLPATIFTRGFVKAYAKEVGLDPDETADLYLAQLAPETLAVDAENARLKVATPLVRKEVVAFEEDNARLIKTQQAGRFGRVLLAIAVVGLVAYIGSFSWDGWEAWRAKVDPTAAADARPADTVAATATPAPAPDATAAALTAGTPLADGPLQFEMKPQGPCWLSAAADGTRVLSELLQAGDHRKIEVRDELVLRVGDPGACLFSINGQEGRPLGPAGSPVNVRITKDNFREFLSS